LESSVPLFINLLSRRKQTFSTLHSVGSKVQRWWCTGLSAFICWRIFAWMRQAKGEKQNKIRHHDTQALCSEWMSFEIFMIYCFIGVFLKKHLCVCSFLIMCCLLFVCKYL
jgi:hypothetical protein